MDTFIHSNISYIGDKEFSFLNLSHKFDNDIDWDFSNFGKLWTYNLNYFEFLNQANQDKYSFEYGLLIDDFVKKISILKNANEPFPTSLRVINWIKFFISNDIKNTIWDKYLYSQCYVLLDQIEYHIMGNHLLENGFALTISGMYFQDSKLFNKGKLILNKELNEQILDDGAHFELTPMYHLIMLSRLLDTINILQSNQLIIATLTKNLEEFNLFLKDKGEKMCGWINAILFKNGEISHFNDSITGIAPPVDVLLNYAKNLGLLTKNIKLSGSGYRKIENDLFEIIIKGGKIGPDYIPGHAHADSLSISMSFNNKSFIVDPGISTYEKNERRQIERSSKFHNTVVVDDNDSSEVWGGFRVGKRAFGSILEETTSKIVTSHTGYKVNHVRKIEINDSVLYLKDEVKNCLAKAYFHFFPDIKVLKKGDDIVIAGNSLISFFNCDSIEIESYQFCLGFNKVTTASKVIVSFKNYLSTEIKAI